jgi:hypothetical protein
MGIKIPCKCSLTVCGCSAIGPIVEGSFCGTAELIPNICPDCEDVSNSSLEYNALSQNSYALTFSADPRPLLVICPCNFLDEQIIIVTGRGTVKANSTQKDATFILAVFDGGAIYSDIYGILIEPDDGSFVHEALVQIKEGDLIMSSCSECLSNGKATPNVQDRLLTMFAQRLFGEKLVKKIKKKI